MTEASFTSESSLLIWLLAAGVSMLAAYVSLGWVRTVQHAAGWRGQWRGLLLAAAVLGTAICAGAILTMAGEALPFAVGYSAVWAAALWPLAVAGCLPALAWVANNTRWWALACSGALIGVVVMLVHMGWVAAAGFRPGIVWSPEFVASAGILLTVGCASALWLGFSDLSQDSSRRTLWRLGAAVLLTLTLMAGREVLVLGIGLPAQVGSVYLQEVPGSVLTLVCGVLLPLLLAVLAVDLNLRRNDRRRARSRSQHSANFNPQRRPRRKKRLRGI